MPQPSSEPDKYTIDEMMDRLKGRNSSDKEPVLVTRTDGSQAMKVKKRRRRTNQAVNNETKRNKRIQIIQITGFVVVVFLLGLAAGIGILYANSSNFRESLVSKLQESSGAEVSLNRFRMNPVAANANGVSLKWPEGNALAALDLTSVVAKIAPLSFTGKSFAGEEIVAPKGVLVLRAPNAEEASRLVPRSSDPLSVKFSRYSVPSLDIRFGEGKGWRASFGKTEASLYPINAAGQAEIRLRGGLLQISGWPEMVLDRSYIKVRDSEFQIKTMRFNIPEAPENRSLRSGFIDFSGSIFPLEGEGSHRLTAKVERFRLPFLLGGDLGRFFFGNVDSKEAVNSNFLSFASKAPEAAKVEVTVSNTVDSRVDISGFGFLPMLSLALDDRWYEFPNFEDDVTLIVKRSGGKVEVSDINLVNRGRMVIRGAISNGDGGKITGNLRVGIPETVLAAAPDKKLKLMFGQLEDGYHWMNVEVGGTTAIPADNFKEIYDKVSVAPKEEVAPSQDSFEKLIEGR